MTLFVSDLDGTLLNDKSRLSDASRQMLNEAIARGAKFSVATARTPSTVSFLLQDVHANLPYIVMTGAALWNADTGSFFNCKTIDSLEADKILSIVSEAKLPAFIYTIRNNRIHVYHTGILSDLEKRFISEREGSEFKYFDIPESGFSLIPSPLENVALFYVMQPFMHVEKVFHSISNNVKCYPVFYRDIFGEDIGLMEIFSHEVSKANALKWLRCHIGADRVVAFGDNVNDIPLLREADVAIAVENALPEVKEMADIVIGPNTSDAVARYILENTI